METAHPESVIPSRAQALFAEVPVVLRHPLLLAMPFPHGAPSHLFELEQHVCQALDPQGSETLRCAAIRCTGLWLWRYAEDMNVEAFMSDFFQLLDRLLWSVSLLHAFAVAHIRASAMMIHRRESRESTQRIFILTKLARELPVGHLVGPSVSSCLERFQQLLKNLMWREPIPLGFMECFKAAELLSLLVEHGKPLGRTWELKDRLEFHTETAKPIWRALRAAADRDPVADVKSAGAARMDPLKRSLYESVLKRLNDAIATERAASNGQDKGKQVLDPTARASAAQSSNGPKIPHRIVVWGPVPPAHDKGDKDVLERFKPLQSPQPVALLPDVPRLEEIQAKLLAEFPWASAAIGTIFDDLITRRVFGALQFHLRPVLLLGPPGVGKTRFARRFAEEIDLEFRAIGMGNMSDILTLTGTSRGYASGQPSVLLEPLLNDKSASALVLLDEIDKVIGAGRRTPPLSSFLLGLLEPESARRWFDSFLQTDCDLTGMVFIATANDLTWLSNALRSRFTILDFGSPSADDIRKAIPFALEDIAQDWHLPKEVFASIEPPANVKVPNMRALKEFLTRYLAVWAKLNMGPQLKH